MQIPTNAELMENIFTDLPGCNCFACSPAHEWGLRMTFFLDRDGGRVLSPLDGPKEAMSSFPGVLHGGFQAMLLDETMFWAAYGLASRITFTGRLEVRLSDTVHTETPLLVEGMVEKRRGPLILCEGRILGGNKKLASGKGTFYAPTAEEFKKSTGLAEIPEKFLPFLR